MIYVINIRNSSIYSHRLSLLIALNVLYLIMCVCVCFFFHFKLGKGIYSVNIETLKAMTLKRKYDLKKRMN